MDLMNRRGLMMAAVDAYSAVKIGEEIVHSGDEKMRLRVDLPLSWENKYDIVVALCAAGTVGGDWIYAPYSSTGAAGPFITTQDGIMYHIPLLLCKEDDKFYYKGLTSTASEVTPGNSDFITIRAYTNTRKLIEGSYLTVYGLKPKT